MKKSEEGLIPKHGGYRNTKTFQISEIIYDVTVLFCDKYIDRFSRTRDQMVQAARSGRQNIAEGSVDSATSRKIELKLTGVAKGSLEELQLDYEDFLRQRGLPKWEPSHPALERFKKLRCANLDEFRAWVADETKRTGELPSTIAANGALSLLNLCVYLLDRQMKAQAKAFEEEGGFTERLYRRRRERREGTRTGTREHGNTDTRTHGLTQTDTD